MGCEHPIFDPIERPETGQGWVLGLFLGKDTQTGIIRVIRDYCWFGTRSQKQGNIMYM